MKHIVKISIIVFLFFGIFVSLQSCEEKLSETDNLVTPELTAKERIHVKSNTSISEQLVTITDCNLNVWQRSAALGASGTILFVDGPSTPPLGNGSVQFSCPDQKIIRLKNDQFSGTLLSNITEFSYSTYVQQSSSIENDNIFIVLQIDTNNDNIVDFPVVFNPTYQTGNYIKGLGLDQGVIQLSTWQTWDLLNGVWWRGPAPDPWNGGVLFTLTSLINQYPNAKIMQGGNAGSIRINGGAPVFAGPFKGYADNFKIGINGVATIYDFEETTANAGPDQNTIYGYGSNCTILIGTASGGVAPYTYSWSPGGSTPEQTSTEVCPTVSTTYTLTVTDVNGCRRTDDVTVFVNDVRCGHNMNKVRVCHKGIEICIASEAIKEHLSHGDVLGNCQPKSN